ncbi:MAG: glycosyltransferase family 2 protein [Deltaproteobacteria bacterium]|jgi:hypothetical protein|nr:glycosyltransferase family 2 protein [Deltaproteobacteria bacterium]
MLMARKTVNFQPQLLRGVPSNDSTPILVCMERNSAWRLPCFLEHYRKLGIKRFVFIDNNSTDDSAKILAAQPDVGLYFWGEPFNTAGKQAVLQSVLELYGYDRWYLIMDVDELLVYDGMEQHSLQDLTRLAEEAKIWRVRGVLVDMFADCPLDEYNKLDEGAELISECCYFDANRKIYHQRIGRFVSFGGGVRQQIKYEMGITTRKNELTKTPLFFFSKGDLLVSSHFMIPYWKNFKSESLLGLLHYRFSKHDFAGATDLSEKDVRRKGALNFVEWFRNNAGRTMMDEHSKKYSSPQDLIDSGFISGINWNNRQQSGMGLDFFALSTLFDKQKRRRAWKQLSWKIRGGLF